MSPTPCGLSGPIDGGHGAGGTAYLHHPAHEWVDSPHMGPCLRRNEGRGAGVKATCACMNGQVQMDPRLRRDEDLLFKNSRLIRHAREGALMSKNHSKVAASAPPPLWGRGWGGGSSNEVMCAPAHMPLSTWIEQELRTCVLADAWLCFLDPPPYPSPTLGGGKSPCDGLETSRKRATEG